MNELAFIAYEFLAVAIPFMIAFFIIRVYYTRRGEKAPHFLPAFVFCIYISAVFYFTGAGTIFDLLRFGIHLNTGLNLLPFSNEIDIVAYALNVVLFVPFGFFIPLLGPAMNRLKSAVLSGLLFSLFIEVSQLFNNRQTDIDDLLLNTLGALIGYLIFRLFSRVVKWADRPANHLKHEPLIYTIVMFLGHFLLFNGMGIARILYGF